MPERPVLPPRLKRGDTIGLVCPAGPVRDALVKLAHVIVDRSS